MPHWLLQNNVSSRYMMTDNRINWFDSIDGTHIIVILLELKSPSNRVFM